MPNPSTPRHSSLHTHTRERKVPSALLPSMLHYDASFSRPVVFNSSLSLSFLSFSFAIIAIQKNNKDLLFKKKFPNDRYAITHIALLVYSNAKQKREKETKKKKKRKTTTTTQTKISLRSEYHAITIHPYVLHCK